jgi:hypothetical protein
LETLQTQKPVIMVGFPDEVEGSLSV